MKKQAGNIRDMMFHRYEPDREIKRLIECYWNVEDADTTPREQKIIPDGFIEIIFHSGDPYRIRLKERWALQQKNLFAGQIRKYFFLRNTGRSGVFGVKLKPTAIAHLFNLPMDRFTDTVMPLAQAFGHQTTEVVRQVASARDDRQKMDILNSFFLRLNTRFTPDHPVDQALEMIFTGKGMIAVAEIATNLSVSERYLEQLFKKYVGLSPKFYARIIRFSQLFQLIKNNAPDWGDLVFQSGYYDQSHFIRNFKAFTGEDPSRYLFSEKSLANFFLQKE